MNRKPVVRAVDVGYGNTKYVMARDVENGGFECALFPSLAPRSVTSSDIAASEGFLKKRNTARVRVNGFEYEVGPDSPKAQNGSESGRVLKEDYCLTDNYRALVYGALHQMQEDVIDVLVLGLPMSTWRQYKDELAKCMAGEHAIAEDRKVEIGKVIVAPQPLGGFYDHSLRIGQFRSMKEQMSLVIDPGFYTLDWLLVDGIVPVDARSNAVNNGGMAEILREVVEQVAKDFEASPAQIGAIERIDRSMRENQPIRVFGKDSKRPIGEYVQIARKRATDPLLKLVQNVGASGDIDNIMIVGGGAHIYADLIKREFPRNNVSVVQDAVFSNVRGFQVIGETWARSNWKG